MSDGVIRDETHEDEERESAEEGDCAEVTEGFWVSVDDPAYQGIDEMGEFNWDEDEALGCLVPVEGILGEDWEDAVEGGQDDGEDEICPDSG